MNIIRVLKLSILVWGVLALIGLIAFFDGSSMNLFRMSSAHLGISILALKKIDEESTQLTISEGLSLIALIIVALPVIVDMFVQL